MSQSLGALWEAINSLQLMVHMSMFQSMVPQNVVMFDEKIQELVNFDFIPLEVIFERLNLSKPVDEEANEPEQEEEDDSTGRRL